MNDETGKEVTFHGERIPSDSEKDKAETDYFIEEPDALPENATPTMESLIALSDELILQRRMKDDAEKLASEAGATIVQIEEKMTTIMQAFDMQNFTRGDRLFYQIVESYPSIKDEETFFTYLEEIGQDGIVKRTVHSQTLRAFYKQHPELAEVLTAKKDEDSPPMLAVFERIKIGVRKATKGK